jgi:hypothetical protein
LKPLDSCASVNSWPLSDSSSGECMFDEGRQSFGLLGKTERRLKCTLALLLLAQSGSFQILRSPSVQMLLNTLPACPDGLGVAHSGSGDFNNRRLDTL